MIEGSDLVHQEMPPVTDPAILSAGLAVGRLRSAVVGALPPLVDRGRGEASGPTVGMVVGVLFRMADTSLSAELLLSKGRWKDAAILILTLTELRLDLQYVAEQPERVTEWLAHRERGRKPWKVAKQIRTLFPVGAGPQMNPRVARPKTFGDVLREYRTHPEPKSLGPDGETCGKQTVGLLQKHHVWVVEEEWIGKESNRMEDVQNGLVHDWNEVVESYGLLGSSRWLPRLKELKASELAEAAGVSVRHVKAVRNGDSPGSPSLRRKLVLAVFRLLAG